MSVTQYILSIAVSTIFSWIIALLLIKLLFYPKNAITILGFRVQGWVPRKHRSAIKNLAQRASSFISLNEIEETITHPGNFEQLKPEIEEHIDYFLRNKLKEAFPMLSAFIGDKTIKKLKESFLIELEILFPVLIKNYVDKIKQNINIEEMVEVKLAIITSAKIEQFFNRYAKKRLLLLATCFGFLIGNIQIFVTLVAKKF